MKKNMILSILLMLCTLSLLAGPAYPGRIVYTQPDGSTIGLRLHGDEFGHWMTNDAGQFMKQDADGFWRVSDVSIDQIREKAAVRREEANRARREYAQKAASSNTGSPKIPVILVGFSDCPFTKSKADFEAMLMEEGYSANNAIGSVYDYYQENSFGRFTPQFEVLGPVQVGNTMAYYGANVGDDDVRPELLLVDAAQILDNTVDFSRYDNDGDRNVDFVVFYFAGYDEAQYGPANAIWSHAWYLSSSRLVTDAGRTFDGVKLDRYFCTSELKWNSGSTMCSIGTTCHEFAHTLGLPDFYDTDYEENGDAANMYDFDLMANGSYNVDSTTPPYLNAEELNEIGWLASIPTMPSSGAVTLPAVNYPGASAYSAYRVNTAVSNEYFMFETRGGQRWDAGIPAGLLVYHVDKSSNRVSGSRTAATLWNSNMLNAYSSHPCCYVVQATNPTSSALYNGALANLLFPGNGNVRSYTPTAWSGNTVGIQLMNITYANQVVTFHVANANLTGVTGMVMDADGNPIAGATVQASSSSAVADSGGNYLLELAAGTYQVTASAEGYASQTLSVTVTSGVGALNFYLSGAEELLPDELIAWPTDLGLTRSTVGTTSSAQTAQNQYPSSIMRRYAGKQIKAIKFYVANYTDATYEGPHIIIDYDGERKATVPVSSVKKGGYTTVDLRDQELIIPTDRDIYAGVGFTNGGYLYNGYYYLFGCYRKSASWPSDWAYEGWISYFNATRTGTRTDWDMVFDITLTIGDYEGPDVGYNYIADPGNGVYSVGEVFPLTLVETEGARRPGSAIAWYLDDEPVSGPSVTLSAGTHVIEARFATTEGKTKVVELTVTAE